MKIHFIGIGGIGISGLAQYMHFKGHEVSGSDIKETPLIKKLIKMGIKITIPHSSDAISDQETRSTLCYHSPRQPRSKSSKRKGH